MLCYRPSLRQINMFYNITKRRIYSMWTKPSFEDLRIGFEVTMYFSNR